MAAADATAAVVKPHTHDETGAIVPEGEEPQPAIAEASTGPQSNEERRQAAMEKVKERIKSRGMFGGVGGALGAGGWLGVSDIRLKENIHNTGVSPSGIPIYEFNYIGDTNRYSGAMAQDLLKTNPDAVSMDTSGYYMVNYNNIDVDMHLLN